jgi:hypothetical protein
LNHGSKRLKWVALLGTRMGDETHECANCGSKWQMVENTDVGGPNVCPVCMADDWNKPHHYD